MSRKHGVGAGVVASGVVRDFSPRSVRVPMVGDNRMSYLGDIDDVLEDRCTDE